ncbi:unnamed protein product [Euphydryas editha]|uniref:Uncharacterized protein n=1 Tax=Euphydryas editha TaxID=104508 RepID=A0AAU9UL14_EUPED|nr:unnamed protein product [Euphydryas editha]
MANPYGGCFFSTTIDVVVSFQYDPELNKMTNEGNAKINFANILKSLVKLNDERVTNLQNLYLLNNYDYGKGSLRTLINNAENYDDLIKNIRVILNGLNTYENIAPYPFNDYQHDLSFDPYLRQLEDSDPDDLNDDQMLNGDKDVSEVSENLTPKLEATKNESLRYYYYSCNGEDRCQKSCRAAFRRACDDVRCSSKFRKEMRRQCRKSCERYFD